MRKYTFEDMVETYQKQMLYVANRILNHYHDAEDAVQTALLRISKQFQFLPQDERVLRAYFLTAAKHAALDLLPKRPEDLSAEKIVAVSSEDLFETVAASQDYERLLSAIKSLPPLYRDVLMLRYVHQLETKHIAKLLNRPRGTVQKQLLRAKNLLTLIYNKEVAQND